MNVLCGLEMHSTGSVAGPLMYSVGSKSNKDTIEAWRILRIYWVTFCVACGPQIAYIIHTRCGHQGTHPSTARCMSHASSVPLGLKILQPQLYCATSFNFSGIMRLQIRIFSVVTPWSLIDSYQQLGGPSCCLYLPGKTEDRSSRF
jgi:hypothetical protein